MGNRRALRLPAKGGDHVHCALEPSPRSYSVSKIFSADFSGILWKTPPFWRPTICQAKLRPPSSYRLYTLSPISPKEWQNESSPNLSNCRPELCFENARIFNESLEDISRFVSRGNGDHLKFTKTSPPCVTSFGCCFAAPSRR